MEKAQQIAVLHAEYVRLTGLDIRLDMERERNWFDWLRQGWTIEDLRLVIGQLKEGLRKGDRRPGCLRFRNLILMIDAFEEELAQARKDRRPPPPRVDPNRAVVLRATGRAPAPPPPDGRKADEIVTAAFDKLKKELKR